jgi:hypothetical protein
MVPSRQVAAASFFWFFRWYWLTLSPFGSFDYDGCRSILLVQSAFVAKAQLVWFNPKSWLPLLALGSFLIFGYRS